VTSVVNRYYDPTTGSFVSVDPDVIETGQMYAYAGDDPVDDVDPLGLYEYSYYWDLGTATQLGSAQGVFSYFVNNASAIFPFSLGGCQTLYKDESCTFHPPALGVSTNDYLDASKMTSTSITLTVRNWCQVGNKSICVAGDPPGSTITFSVGYFQCGKHVCVFLEQHANAPGAGPGADVAVDYYHQAIFAWQAQADNLAHALCGNSNPALIEGAGWSTA
jgi:uncharacterized protein RhaS with RHS repeats